LTKQDKERWD